MAPQSLTTNPSNPESHEEDEERKSAPTKAQKREQGKNIFFLEKEEKKKKKKRMESYIALFEPHVFRSVWLRKRELAPKQGGLTVT